MTAARETHLPSTSDDFDGDTIYVERPGGFEQIPDALWFGGACTEGALMAYVALSKRGGREDRGIPKRSTLAKDMGVKSIRTVDARLDELIEKGWLLITPRFRPDGDQGQTSNHYRLLWTPITSEDDPRLVKHREEIAAFDAAMAERQRRNGTQGARSTRSASWKAPVQDSARGGAQDSARGERSNLHGGSADSCTPPAQLPAPQESDLLGTTPPENHTNPGDASAPPPPAADPEPAQPKSKSKKGTRLPEDWEPSARLLEWAITGAPLVDVKVETENFRDHWLSVSGQRGVMLDWDRTWQKWMRKEQAFREEREQRRRTAAGNRYDDEATWGVRPPASEPAKSTERPQYDIDELFGTPAQQSVDSATG